MVSQSLAVLVAAASLVLAKTPVGFTPSSNTDLVVIYSGISADNGAVVSKSSTLVVAGTSQAMRDGASNANV